jgi:hypothetical protein
MLTLREAKGSETTFTKELATDTGIIELNKINLLLGLPSINKATNEYSIHGGSIDVVGYTVKGEMIVYEHQDLTGRADQTHVFKTKGYADVLSVKNCKVLATVLLCESIDQIYLDLLDKWREKYHKRPTQMGAFNIHAVKSQWTDEGVYEPALFTDTEIIPTPDTVLNHYAEFVKIYGAEWSIQREDYKKANENAITLWHRLPELDNRYMAYVHTLKGSIKVGLHCENRVDEQAEQFLQKVCPEGFTYNRAKKKATIEVSFPKNTAPEVLADETEKLKRSIRKHLTFA